MRTDKILQFCAVVETGSLSKASELLDISPGALSRAMKSLEKEVSLQLFKNVGRGLALTNKAQKFYVTSKKLVSEFNESLERIRSSDNEISTISIGSFEVFTTHLLAEMMNTEFKDESFLVRELTPGKLEEALSNREIDFGLTYVPVPRPEIDYLEVGRFRMNAFIRKNVFSDRAWFEIPFAVPITNLGKSVSGLTSLDGWPADVQRKVKFHFQLLETGLQACRRGLCAFVIPDFIAALTNRDLPDAKKLVVLKVPALTRRETLPIYLVKRKDSDEGKVEKRIAKAIRIALDASAKPS